MRAWKHLLLLLGLLGVSGLFAPMLEVKQGRIAVELSARQLSFGFQETHSLLERELPKLAEKYLPGSVRSTRRDLQLVSEASRWAALAYVPAGLMVLLGLIGILRRRFGRALGTLALLCGFASIGAWAGLRFGIELALREAELQKTQVALLFGAHLLLVAGAAAVIAGIGALISPDRGPGPMRLVSGPRLPPPPGPPPGFPPPPAPPPHLPPPAGR